MRTLLLAVTAALLVTFTAASHPAIHVQPTDYQQRIDDALRRLRLSAADAAAWHDLNGGVRAALDADDLPAVVDAAVSARDLLQQLMASLGATEGVGKPGPALTEAANAVNDAIDAALAALQKSADDSARAALLRAQDLARRGAETASIQAKAAVAGGAAPAEVVPALLQAGGLAAAVGADPATVDAAFGDLRELVLSGALPQQLDRAACGGTSATAYTSLARALGITQEQIDRLAANATCRFGLSGTETVEFAFNLSGAGTARRVITGTLSLSLDVAAAGTVQGSGTAQVTLSYDVSFSGGACRSTGGGSLPVQVSGEASGSLLRLRIEPRGTVPGTFTCTYDPVPGSDGAIVSQPQPLVTDAPILLPATTTVIEIEARDGAQAHVVEHPPLPGSGGTAGITFTVTWDIGLTRQR